MRYIAAILLLIANAASVCTKPAISAVASSAPSTSGFTITWTTDVAANTRVAYSAETPTGSARNAGVLTAITDAAGVTSHSVTLTGLYPYTTYGFGVISEGISGGSSCGSAYRSFSGGGDTTSFQQATSNIVTTAPNTYDVVIDSHNSTHVAQGYGIWLEVEAYTTNGTIAFHGLKTVVTGLPSNVAIEWKQFAGANSQFTTTTTNDSYDWYQIDTNGGQNDGNAEFHLTTNSGGTTATGDYTLTFTTSDQGANGLATVTRTFIIHVDQYPYGINFAFATPSSYPAIPCLNSGDKEMDNVTTCPFDWTSNMKTYGAFNARNDWDNGTAPTYGTAPTSCSVGVRCLTANDSGNLCPVSGGSQTCSWYYDGMEVYEKIARYFNDRTTWQQAIDNVRNVYLSYATTATGSAYTHFTHGFYDHWVHTASGDDKTAADNLAQHIYNPGTGASYVRVFFLQREVAYSFKNLWFDKRIGGTAGSTLFGSYTLDQQISYALDHLLQHLDQICWSQTADYWENFMVPLEQEALISYYEAGNKDARIPAAIKCSADYLWNNQWNTITDDGSTFAYDMFDTAVNKGPVNGGAASNEVVNLLHAPAYAWLFKNTGNGTIAGTSTTYQTAADTLFQYGVLWQHAGGPNNVIGDQNCCSGLNSGKQFSQQYYWSTDFVNWRSAPIAPARKGKHKLGGGIKLQ